MKTKTLAIILMLAMLAALLPACKSGDEVPPPGRTTEPAKTSAKPQERVKISYVSWNFGEIQPNSWAEQWIEERINVDLEPMRLDLSNAERRSLMFSTGEFPDCGWVYGAIPVDLFADKIIRAIPINMVREYSPSFAALADGYPLIWKVGSQGHENEVLSLPGVQSGMSKIKPWASVYRYDWLEKVGIEPKGNVRLLDFGEHAQNIYATDEPFTLEELETILEKFVKEDPDNNGKNDTIGMIADDGFGSRKSNLWVTLKGCFGLGAENLEEDGKLVLDYASKAYKEFLTYAARLYKKGLIDKEFSSLSRFDGYEKFTEGKGGFIRAHVQDIDPTQPWASKVPPVSIRNNEGIKALVAPPESRNGVSSGPVREPTDIYNAHFLVNVDVDDQKLAEILKLFEFINFDNGAVYALRWGEEGVHFEYGDKENKSLPTLKEGMLQGNDTGLWAFNANYICPREMLNIMYPKVAVELQDMYFLPDGKLSRGIFFPYRLDLFNETAYAEKRKLLNPTLSAIEAEYFYDVIGGAKNVDDSWDSYINDLKTAGYDELVAELEKAPLYADLVK